MVYYKKNYRENMMMINYYNIIIHYLKQFNIKMNLYI